jgi:hypothetical protein
MQTFQVDRDAAIHYINASAAHPSITRFLLISYLGSRRSPAPWWKSADPEFSQWKSYEKEVNYGVLANYYQAKIAADEALYRTSRDFKAGAAGGKKEFVSIDLRPGTLSDENEGGVEIGKTTNVKGNIGRKKVAIAADALLAAEGIKSTWVDLYEGDEDIQKGVERVVSEGISTVEGEPVTKE